MRNLKNVLNVLNKAGIDVAIYTDEAKAAAAAKEGRRVYVLKRNEGGDWNIEHRNNYIIINYPYNMRSALPGAIIAEEEPVLAQIVEDCKARRLSNIISEIRSLEAALISNWRQHRKELKEKDAIVSYAAAIHKIRQHPCTREVKICSNGTLEIVTKPLLMKTPLYERPVPIGRFKITYSFAYTTFSIYANHPHVFSGGSVCFGDAEDIRKASANDPAVVFDIMMEILTNHNPANEIRPLSSLLDSINIRIIHEEQP